MSVDTIEENDTGDMPVAIGLFASSVEAAFPAALLQSHGIDAHLLGEAVGSTLSGYGLAIVKIELVVPSREADRARQILMEHKDARTPRLADWKCSGCGEINGAEFDACWSCGKLWSGNEDSEHEDESAVLAMPSEIGHGIVLPDIDPNPYAPPFVTTVATSPDHDAAGKAIRRTRTGMVLSLLFPPLILLVLFEAANALAKTSGGELPCSPHQRTRLLAWAFFAILEMVAFVALFLVMQW